MSNLSSTSISPRSSFLSNAVFDHSSDAQQLVQGAPDSVVYGTFKSAPSMGNGKIVEDDDDYSNLPSSSNSAPAHYSSKGTLTPVQMHTILKNGIKNKNNITIHNMATNKDLDPRLNQIEKLENIHQVLPALTDDSHLHLIPYDVEGSSSCCGCKSEDHAVLIVIYGKTIFLIDPKNKKRDYGINEEDIPRGFQFRIHKLGWQGYFNGTDCGRYTAHLAIKFTNTCITVNPGFFNLLEFVADLPQKSPSLEVINKELSGYYFDNFDENKDG